jgi:ankyrin repeat protein
MKACRRSNLSIVSYLLFTAHAHIDTRDIVGKHALSYAVAAGAEEVVKLLCIQGQANVNG